MKVNFRYSDIYERNWKEWIKLYNKPEIVLEKNQIIDFMNKTKQEWKLIEDKIFNMISEISGFKWKFNNIECYFVSNCIPFSDPLTVCSYEKYPNSIIDTLTHELIHRIFNQNHEIFVKIFEFLRNKYNENDQVLVHVVLFSIHKKIILEMFGKERYENYVKSLERIPNYKKAFELMKDFDLNDVKKIVDNYEIENKI